MPDQTPDSAIVLTLVRDLMFRPRVDSSLKIAGHEPRAYRVDTPVAEQIEAGRPALGLVDLAAASDNPTQVIVAMRKAGLNVIGFCGHVDEAAQAAGVAAGVSLVASRGQLHSDLPGLVTKALAIKPDPDCDYC